MCEVTGVGRLSVIRLLVGKARAAGPPKARRASEFYFPKTGDGSNGKPSSGVGLAHLPAVERSACIQ